MIALCWLRRDLRLNDQAALYHALRSGFPVVPVFVFDTNILDDLEDKADRRLQFIHDALENIQLQLKPLKSTLDVFSGTPEAAFRHWMQKYPLKAVYTNHDYEPYARNRDAAVAKLLEAGGISFHSYKDQVIFEQNEVVKDNGEPYTVFTPYSKKWLSKLDDRHLRSYPTEEYHTVFYQQEVIPVPSLRSIGFEETVRNFPDSTPEDALIRHYDKTRDYPAEQGTSRLGVHLRFGTISIRALARKARQLNQTYLKELIWREFYQMILSHFPHLVHRSFRPAYDAIQWRNNEEEFARWCRGATGYPIVDAGMRELNATGFMHNRVRMITASFLTKHLLTDWRWGEAYFAQKLLDYELASNNGNWQWAAGSGCDAAPYFRVFNPALQTEKFDKGLEYVRRWVPEMDEPAYMSSAIIAHDAARQRALEVYGKALKNEG
ncbi:cryptochrome/photolyase family protein [Chitinophaga cymbidii]|uniref:Deoxyribodipyrimidine photo-lyase n=1 Tax=Chitinophaga cymbidii TaxID=1096750 RepID=A0A512RJX3_9BACT|nr:deoxyribodipyrimidine photo-lyase [Chitinophaga cymbidii]GEP95972.1 deoxyribodipyrimidine photo-lyase [Chitinophaga cymbidii]